MRETKFLGHFSDQAERVIPAHAVGRGVLRLLNATLNLFGVVRCQGPKDKNTMVYLKQR